MGLGRARAKWGEGDMANLLVRSASSEEQRELAGDERRRGNSSVFVEMAAPVDGIDEVLA